MSKILEPIFNKLDMSKAIVIEFDKSQVGNIFDMVILYHIIQVWFFLNILQHIIFEEVLSHVINNN